MTYKWSTVRLSDFVTFNPKAELKRGSVARYVPMDKVMPFTKRVSNIEESVYSGGAKFCNGDTIMARITPCLENGKTAYIDFLNDGEAAFGSTEFIVLRAKLEISDPQFIYYLAISPEFRQTAIKSMVGSSGRQRVQQDMLENMILNVPPIEEQRAISRYLAMLDDKIAVNHVINDNLAA